ncbi:hypothetical protein JYU34_014564 [Plutella xylostella]|uniref:B-block binding subunit of TFIIIC domain-containing protein n=1 Tax=Plutella xylostella TaxID=51655 RepID=A0ABQ7Q8N5_PLUXY|nr:hypothetical protein JYU34_014564 [Plutella xylostella]
MGNPVINQFHINFKDIAIDEIALEGLDGIDVDLFWRRVEKRCSSSLSEKLKTRIWNFLLANDHVAFYKLPSPREPLEIRDRFSTIEETSGNLIEPPECFDGPYEYCPVPAAYGSCKDYNERVLIPKEDLKCRTLTAVVEEYGQCLVMVASLEERWRALAPQLPISQLKSLNLTHYCLLELIGKSRENGQMSAGNSNLLKIVKDPKFLFYNRKQLVKLGLIKVSCVPQVSGNRGAKAILLSLKRFYKSRVAMIPRHGIIHNIIQYLKEKPDFTERTDVLVKKKLASPSNIKRMKKVSHYFLVEDKDSEREGSEPVSKKRRLSDLSPLTPKKYLILNIQNEESSASEDESPPEAPLKCQYSVGVNLLRQAYEKFIEAGMNGLTQVQLGQVLGIEFYTCRSICRMFKARNIVREVLEDRGRQRTARYIARASKGTTDQSFAEEKQKMLDYIHNASLNLSTQNCSDDGEPVEKKLKTEGIDEAKIIEVPYTSNPSNPGFLQALNSKKPPTLRQLKYANGILKVTRERLSVTGYQTLSTIVAEEIKEPRLDTKALATLVHKLFAEKQVKLFKLAWPGHHQRYSNLICAPHVTATHDVITRKYREICIRSYINKEVKTPKVKKEVKTVEQLGRPFKLYAYPRYMKVRKLHEFICKLVYFRDNPGFPDLPPGFASLIHMIPEMSVELAVGHISSTAMTQILPLRLTEAIMGQKLREVPQSMYKTILQSKSLQTCLRATLAVLSSFGLIQLCLPQAIADHHSGLLKYIFYVNRNAKLLDTTGTWPRDVDPKTIEKTFKFDTLDDVVTYWQSLFDISLGTIVLDRDKSKQMPPARIRSLKDVEKNDDGSVYGDGGGPAGLDSTYYLELQRHWETMHVVNYKKTTLQALKLKKAKRLAAKNKEKKPAKKPIKPAKVKLVASKKPAANLKRKRLPERVLKWTKNEDYMLLLCKAALTIMSPNSQPGCLTVRNLVAKDILSAHDPGKTASFCHKRSVMLESNSTLTHERECLVSELRRRPHLASRYENRLKKVRLAHSLNMAKFISSARLPAMELVHILLQISRSKSYTKRVPCVALNLEEFNRNYDITMSTSQKAFNLYRTSPDCSDEVTTLKESIIMALAFKDDENVKKSEKVYTFLDKYSETQLRTAIEHLRKSSAISVKEKSLNNILNRFSFSDMVKTTSSFKATMSTYKFSAAYQRRQISKLNSEFVDQVANILNEELPTKPGGSPEMNCVVCELLVSNEVALVTESSPYITGSSGTLLNENNLNNIDIEAHYKLKLGTVQCVFKKDVKVYAEIFPEVDYAGILDSLVSDATIRKAKTKKKQQDKIIDILQEKKENGCTFMELKNLTGHDTKTLVAKLQKMETNGIVKLVGFYENLLVLTEFIKPWSVQNLDEHRVIPTPWLSLEGRINKNLFLKWCGVILNKVFEHPAISIQTISEDIEFISSRSVQDVLMFLERSKLVTLKVMTMSEPDLFSEDLLIEEEEFYKYASPQDIVAYPAKDAFTKYACLRKAMLS